MGWLDDLAANNPTVLGFRPAANKPSAPPPTVRPVPLRRDQRQQHAGEILRKTKADIARIGSMAPGAVRGAQSDLQAALDAEIAKINAQYGGGGGGGGGAGYAQAIADAKKMIRDVQENRAALHGVYDEYTQFVDPLGEEAIAAAGQVVAQGTPGLSEIDAATQDAIRAAFAQAGTGVEELGALIGAGDPATQDVHADAVDSEAMRIANAIAEGATHKTLLGLEEDVAKTGAVADRSLHDDEFTRRKALVDMEFNQMEEAARERLAQAQAAAAAARRAAAQRRASMMAQRNAAIAEAEQRLGGRLNPFEAGQATALSYLSQNGADLDYNRQQLVLSTLENAVSQQVPDYFIQNWVKAEGLPLKPNETALVTGGVRAFTAGMRHQQTSDKKTTGSSGGFYGRQ
jgi:hypothetical protein